MSLFISEQSKMPSYKLIYFDLPGRGELARLLLHYGGIKFEDKRIGFAEWPEFKKGKPEIIKYHNLNLIVKIGHCTWNTIKGIVQD